MKEKYTTYYMSEYQTGNAVEAPETEESFVSVIQLETQEKSLKLPFASLKLDFLSAAFVMFTIAVCVFVCSYFIGMKQDIIETNRQTEKVTALNRELKNNNDLTMNRLDSSNELDLDYVYLIAVRDLGMVYPNNNEIITFQTQEVGYIRQYADIPK